MFDLRGCTTLKIGKLLGHISSVTPIYTSRLHWILIPGLLLRVRDCTCSGAMDQGSVSTGYCDRPVARAIKIKHAGLNLTGRASEASEKKRKPQASSSKQRLTVTEG